MKYIAMIRGIGPGDPRMTNDKLCGVFELLGFGGVRSIISSGNVVFEADSAPSESMIEKALQAQLGFFRPVIIRSALEIKHLIELKPFGDMEHGQKNYTLVTFVKNPETEIPFSIPYKSDELFFSVCGYDKHTRALFSVTDHTAVPTPKVMTWLEKQLGKENVTSRTWKTVERVYRTFA